eukprot:265910_1
MAPVSMNLLYTGVLLIETLLLSTLHAQHVERLDLLVLVDVSCPMSIQMCNRQQEEVANTTVQVKHTLGYTTRITYMEYSAVGTSILVDITYDPTNGPNADPEQAEAELYSTIRDSNACNNIDQRTGSPLLLSAILSGFEHMNNEGHTLEDRHEQKILIYSNCAVDQEQRTKICEKLQRLNRWLSGRINVVMVNNIYSDTMVFVDPDTYIMCVVEWDDERVFINNIEDDYYQKVLPIVLEIGDTPTPTPTADPTSLPTAALPTKSPFTSTPTVFPTNNPAHDTTNDPTNGPTDFPTTNPTDFPTDFSTTTTDFPTNFPTTNPTDFPTTNGPTDFPTNAPTMDPTYDPITDPTNDPTDFPTADPTDRPTDFPTWFPSDYPTRSPVSPPPTKGRDSQESAPTPPPDEERNNDECPDATNPVCNPSIAPTMEPTMEPTVAPGIVVTVTVEGELNIPTPKPTNEPVLPIALVPTWVWILIGLLSCCCIGAITFCILKSNKKREQRSYEAAGLRQGDTDSLSDSGVDNDELEQLRINVDRDNLFDVVHV